MFFSSRMKLFPSASPLSKTNDVDPKLISCIGPLRLPRSLSVCCRVPTVVRQIGTNKSWIYSLTEAAYDALERAYSPHVSASPAHLFHFDRRFYDDSSSTYDVNNKTASVPAVDHHCCCLQITIATC